MTQNCSGMTKKLFWYDTKLRTIPVLEIWQVWSTPLLPLLQILYRLIGQVGRVFDNGPGDLGSIPGRVIPKTLKTALDTSLLNTQWYHIYPTPPLGQDMTQGQFLGGV